MQLFLWLRIKTTGDRGLNTRHVWNSALCRWYLRRSLPRSAGLHNKPNCAARRNNAVILTGDPESIERLVRASGHEAVVVSV